MKLPAKTEGEQVVEDYVALRLTLRSHPVGLLRGRLTEGEWMNQTAIEFTCKILQSA